jgi:hypothetical protein
MCKFGKPLVSALASKNLLEIADARHDKENRDHNFSAYR